MTRALELSALVRAARARAFLCRHRERRTNCPWCVIDSWTGRTVPTIRDIMAR